MRHEWPIRVYYEDTDLAGIVYYANYLRFTERARTELIRDIGVDQTRLKQEDGIVFAVRQVQADYILPAVFDDRLTVVTEVKRAGGARIELKQDILRDGETLFSSEVTLVALATDGKPARIPAEIRRKLENDEQ